MGRDAAYSLNDNDCRHYINDLCAHACPEATRGRNVSSLVAWQTTWGRLRGGRPHESLYILPLFLCGLMVGAAGAGSGGARPGAEVCTGGAGHVLAAAKSVGAAAAAAVTWVTAEAVVAAAAAAMRMTAVGEAAVAAAVAAGDAAVTGARAEAAAAAESVAAEKAAATAAASTAGAVARARAEAGGCGAGRGVCDGNGCGEGIEGGGVLYSSTFRLIPDDFWWDMQRAFSVPVTKTAQIVIGSGRLYPPRGGG